MKPRPGLKKSTRFNPQGRVKALAASKTLQVKKPFAYISFSAPIVYVLALRCDQSQPSPAMCAYIVYVLALRCDQSQPSPAIHTGLFLTSFPYDVTISTISCHTGLFLTSFPYDVTISTISAMWA